MSDKEDKRWEMTPEQKKKLAEEKPLTDEQKESIKKLDDLCDHINAYLAHIIGIMNSLNMDLVNADAGKYARIQPAIRRAKKSLENTEDELEKLCGYAAHAWIPKWKLEWMADKLHIPLDAMIDPEYRNEQTK